MDNNQQLLTQKFQEFKERFQKLDINNISIETLQEFKKEAENLQMVYKNLELTVKKDSNSLYGSSGNEYYALADYDLATDITMSAKHSTVIVDQGINKFFANWVNNQQAQNIIKQFYPNAKLTNLDYKPHVKDKDLCVYGDTDSRYIDLGQIYDLMGIEIPESDIELADFSVYLMEKLLNQVIADTLAEDAEYRNTYTGYLKMTHEVTTRKSVFIGKKQYIKSPIWKDGKNIKRKLEYTGIELKRGSTSPRLKKILQLIINKYFLENKSFEEIQKEVIGATKYIISRQERSLIYKISAVKDLELIEWDDKKQTYVSPKNHIQHKLAIFWLNYVKKNNHKGIYRKPFNGQKMNWYYDINMNVVAVPDDVDIDKVPNLPKPNYIYMLKIVFIKNILRYITDIKSSDIKMTDIEFFLSGAKKLNI